MPGQVLQHICHVPHHANEGSHWLHTTETLSASPCSVRVANWWYWGPDSHTTGVCRRVHLDKCHRDMDRAHLSKQGPSLCPWKSGLHVPELLRGANHSTARQKLGGLLQKHSAYPKLNTDVSPL